MDLPVPTLHAGRVLGELAGDDPGGASVLQRLQVQDVLARMAEGHGEDHEPIRTRFLRRHHEPGRRDRQVGTGALA